MPLKTTRGDHGGEAIKGRGATINIEGRFEVWQRDSADDGWFQDPGDDDVRPKTVITIEHTQRVTRSILEVLHETHHPVSILTKSALVERDLDLLAPMARDNLAQVGFSITTLNHDISRYMEPRASAPARRLEAVRRLSAAGIPVHVMIGPVIPVLTDSELESILEAAANAGATSAGYVLLRLPWEVKPVFKEWLQKRFPLKYEHVMSRIRDMRDGKENDPNFG